MEDSIVLIVCVIVTCSETSSCHFEMMSYSWHCHCSSLSTALTIATVTSVIVSMNSSIAPVFATVGTVSDFEAKLDDDYPLIHAS